MHNLNPVYTDKAECQDCYKCVRECPVKAIKIQNGSAAIIPEQCVLCGHCVDVCPAGAKRVRDDLDKVKNLISTGRKVYVSLAPSFASEFPDITPRQLIAALKHLGFCAISETALGAQQVSAHVAQQLQLQKGKIFISSACPAVVDFVTRYMPSHSASITNLLSPMLTHSKMLRKKYGKNIAIVFIGPCVAKKREADSHPQLIDAALTFEELRNWLDAEHLHPSLIKPHVDDIFMPDAAEEGALYPIDGGMSATIKANCAINDLCFMSFSGLENIRRALQDLDKITIENNIFIEALSCEGGCVNGPKAALRDATAVKRYAIVKYAPYPKKKIPRTPSIPINEYVSDAPFEAPDFSSDQINAALRQVGKISEKDELNCGGCGYDSCRDFAAALLAKKAETTMCVTYMRKLAQNKASGLLRTMPSGVVIVDSELKIIESNLNFAKLFGSDIETIFDANPGLMGASLKKIVPFHESFKHVFDSGKDIINQDFKVDNRIIHGSIFAIEKQHVTGGVFTDITTPSIQKEQVIKRAQDIIEKNLTMVQKIAYILGENAADSESVLNSIIESFSSRSPSPGNSLD
ncbi:MAG: 4Fe-4S binding protein [Fibrobacter sp.]|nr:4Fe-4S binding protein [Fibrobacter sp.]